MYFNRRCKITFISHGATIYSEEGRFSNSLNYPPLSDLGIEEIENVVRYLKNRAIKNDIIYSSPSVRCIQSSELISKLFKQDFEIIQELTSRRYNDWDGLTYSQIIDKYPNGISDVIANFGSGDKTIEFIKRTKNIINNLVEGNIGNRIIIVTHPDIIQAAICAALDISPDKLLKIYIRTGSMTQISYFENWASLVYSDLVPLQLN